MFMEDDSAVTTVPLVLPEVGPVARIMRKLIGWPNPFKTVTMAIIFHDHLLVVYREPEVHPADWDIAEAVMHRIAHPGLRRSPSLIRDVDTWDIRQVNDAILSLEKLQEGLGG